MATGGTATIRRDMVGIEVSITENDAFVQGLG